MIRAQHLNMQKPITGSMGYSSVYESDNRIPRPAREGGYAQLDLATRVFGSKVTKGLYLLSVQASQPIEGLVGVLDSVCINDSIVLLVDGLDAAKKIGADIHSKTHQPTGIAPYKGIAAQAYFNAQDAASIARERNELFYVFGENGDSLRH